jgi:hypothetical protein
MKVQNPTRRIVWTPWQKTRPGKHLWTHMLASYNCGIYMIILHITQCKEFWQQHSLSKGQRITQTKPRFSELGLETRKLTKKKLTIQLAIIISVASINEFFRGTGFLWRWNLWVLLLWWWQQLLLNTYCFLLFFFFFLTFPSLPCCSHSFQTYCWKFIACKGHWIRHVCKIPKVGVCELLKNSFPLPHWELWVLENPLFSGQPSFFLFLQHPFSETCGYMGCE